MTETKDGKNGRGWQPVAIAALISLLVGGGFGDWRASVRATETLARAESQFNSRLEGQNRRIQELEVSEDKNFEVILKMADRLARIETKLDQLMND